MPVAAVASPRNPVVILKSVSPPLAILAVYLDLLQCQIISTSAMHVEGGVTVSAAGH